MSRSRRVFISYSHDSEPHMARVLELADRLRRDGVDAEIDRYEQAPSRGWVQWMTDHVQAANFVLMVCTETYTRRLLKSEAPGQGLGGVWEGNLLMNSFYQAGTVSNRFVPVILNHRDKAEIPPPFSGLQYYDLSSESGYWGLYRLLTGQPEVERPGLGSLVELSRRAPQWENRPSMPLEGVPAKPALFVGRSGALTAFKQLLGVLPGRQPLADSPRAAAITGWPGVGKSTFVTELPYDPEIQATYPDGIFWVALGQARTDDLLSKVLGTLRDWDQGSSGGVATLTDRADRVRDQLRQRRVLIVVDDSWEAVYASSFLRVISQGCTVVFTSRSEDVARFLVPVATHRYQLEELSVDDGLELLRRLAPNVSEYPLEAAALVRALGGLPLALVVAGRILGSYSAGVCGVQGLLEELRSGERLLKESVPPDMLQLTHETNNLTVAALIRRSTRLLADAQRIRFAQLSVFAPKPASFSVADAAMAWDVDETTAGKDIETLAGLGIVQPMSGGRIQMHALLSRYAASVLKEL